MARVYLDRPWLSLYADQSKGVAVLHRGDAPPRQISIPGNVVVLANGRRRSIINKLSSARDVSLSVALESEADKNLLVAWIGSTMLFRDGYGQAYTCVTFDISWSGFSKNWEADFDLLEVSV